MKLMFLVLSLIVSLTGCGSSGNRGGSSAENIGPIVSLGADIKKSPPDIKLDQMGRVIEINLSKKPVSDDDLKVIAQYKHLQKLWLANTGVTDAGLLSLVSLQKLRVLGLARTSVSDEGLLHLSQFRSLQKVHLYPNKITVGAVEELAAKRKMAKLPRIIVEY